MRGRRAARGVRKAIVAAVWGVLLLWPPVVRAQSEANESREENALRFALSEDGFVRTWLICGPFPNLPRPRAKFLLFTDARSGFTTDWLESIGGEKTAAPREGLPIAVEAQSPCIWRPAVAGPEGHLNLLREFLPNVQVVAYAACTLDCPAPTGAVMKIGSDDGIKVWLNGKRVHESWRAAGWRADEDVVSVALRHGRNRVLVKVDQLILGWGFSLRLTDEAGKPLRDVVVELAGDVSPLDVLRQMARSAAVELERPALTAGDALVARATFGALAPLTTRTLVATGFLEDGAGTTIASIGEVRLRGDRRRPVAFRPFAMPSLRDGLYRVRVDLAPPGGKRLATQRAHFWYVDSYGRRLAEATRAVREAAATLTDRDGLLATVTLPSLERLLLDAEKRWKEFESIEADLGFIRKQLFDAEAAALAMRQGRDWYVTQTGHHVKAYRSEYDGSLQPYSVYIPRDYSPAVARPLVIGLHGAASNHWLYFRRLFGVGNRPGETDDRAMKVMPPLADVPMLVACPNGRGIYGYVGLGEEDVWRVLADMKRAYHVDETRVYLTGASMGGEGTWLLGLLHPDRFAAIAPVCGPTVFSHDRRAPAQPERYELPLLKARSAITYAENALHLPIHIFHGTEDAIIPAANTDVIFRRFRELGYRVAGTQYSAVGHASWDDAYHRATIFDWFASYRRDPSPRRVIYRAVVSKPVGAYWVRIERPHRLRRISTIEATVGNNRVDVRAENIERFSLRLGRRLVNVREAVTITINDQRLPRVWVEEAKPVSFESIDGEFRRVFQPYEPPLLPGLGMSELLAWHTYIYGTAGRAIDTIRNREAAERAANWGEWCDVRWPVKRDDAVTSRDLQTANLVLVGTPANHHLLARIADQLPIAIGRDAIRIGRRTYGGPRAGLAMIYRNPLIPDRYVFIQAAFTTEGFENMRRNMPYGVPDYVIFNGRGRVARAGYFDASWQLER